MSLFTQSRHFDDSSLEMARSATLDTALGVGTTIRMAAVMVAVVDMVSRAVRRRCLDDVEDYLRIDV
jgi:hypothetical protein